MVPVSRWYSRLSEYCSTCDDREYAVRCWSQVVQKTYRPGAGYTVFDLSTEPHNDGQNNDISTLAYALESEL